MEATRKARMAVSGIVLHGHILQADILYRIETGDFVTLRRELDLVRRAVNECAAALDEAEAQPREFRE